MRSMYGVLCVLTFCAVGFLTSSSCGAPSANAGSDGGVDGGMSTKAGVVFVMQDHDPLKSTAGAYFLSDFPTLAALSCSTKDVGSCRISKCNASDAGIAENVGTHFVSAGVLSISGANKPISLEPRDAGGYLMYSASYQGRLWDGGETLSLAATGAEVPAFSGKSIVAPDTLVLTSHDSTTVYDVDRTGTLNLAWLGGTSGTVSVDILVDTAVFFAIACTFPASAGSASLGPEVLAELSPTTTPFLAFWNQQSTSFGAGEYAITFSASTTPIAVHLKIH